MTSCDGVDNVVLLDSFRTLHPVDAPAFARLEPLYCDALDAARSRVAWSRRRDATAVPKPLTTDSARTAVGIAAATDQAVAYVPTETPGQLAEHAAPGRPAPWMAGGPRADLIAQRDAALLGGSVARGASRWTTSLADVGDDLALAHGAQVELLVLSGTLPAGNSLVVGATGMAVAAIDGTVEVIGPDGIDRVEAGQGCRADINSSVRTTAGGHALIAVLGEPTNGHLWSFAAHKAGHRPLVRADLPYDLSQPAAIYGSDEPVLVGPLLREEAAAVLTDATAVEAMAAWRATLRPLDRPRPDLIDLPFDHQDWPPLVLTGHLPGGVTQLGPPEDDRVWLAAGGHAFRTHVHLAPLFEAMVIGEPVSLDKVGVDCPNRDAHCVHRALEQLLWLGLVEAKPGDAQ